MSNGRWLSETSDDVGDREPVNRWHYTLYFAFVKVQLSAFVTLFSTVPLFGLLVLAQQAAALRANNA